MDAYCIHDELWYDCKECEPNVCIHGIFPVESCTICNPYKYDIEVIDG